MAANAALNIDLVVNTKDAQSDLTATASRFSKFSHGLQQAAVPAAAVATAILKIGSDSVKAASDMQQSFGGLDAVFGKNSGVVKQWANDAATSVGLSASEYAGFAARIGASLKNAGVPMDKVAGQTDEMIRLGADLAATYGGTTADAVDALGAALRGEADPAERYGLALNQTAVNARMAAEGTDKLTGKAYTQAKAQTVLALTAEQAGGAIGQFARESDTAAGASQIAAAQFENAKAALGTALLPALAATAAAFAKFAAFVQKHATAFQILIVVILAVAAAILVLNVAMWVLSANPLVLIIAAIVVAVIVLIGVIVILWKKFGMTAKVAEGWARLKQRFFEAVAALKAVWAQAVQTFNAIVNWLQRLLTAVQIVNAAIRAAFQAAWNAIKSTVAAVIAFVIGRIRAFLAAGKSVASAISGAFRSAWNAIRSAAATMASAITGFISRIVGPARAAANGIRSAFQAAWNTIRNAASAVAAFVMAQLRRPIAAAASAASAIRSAFLGAFSALRGAAGGLTGALTAPFYAISGAIQSAIGAVQSLISWLSRIHVPSISIPKGAVAKSAAPAGTPALRSTASAGLVGARTASATTASTTAGGVVINVTGALDPEGVARQIERILTGARRRRVGVAMGQRAPGLSAV